MARLLQRLQRRAIVALAWLVLALSVAPAASEPVRPLTVYAAALSSLALEAGPQGQGQAARVAAEGVRSGPSRIAARHAEAPAPGRRAQRASEPVFFPAVAPQAPASACRIGARDERRLYLSLRRLAC